MTGGVDHVGPDAVRVRVGRVEQEAIGPAAAAMTRVSGTRMTTDQVSSAEVIWLTRAFSAGSASARSAERARTGTIALVSAPPRTSS